MRRDDMDKAKQRRHSSRGFILAMLLAFITAMGIMLTVAMPHVRTQVQREQEAELIFRGEAIVNAIRAYKAKTGGYPLNLTDLTKISPRIIRRIYTDPMTKDGEWTLITAVQPGASGDTSGLPIVGVRSKSQVPSFMIYKGKSLISDWPFSAADNLLGIPSGVSGAANLLKDMQGGNTGGNTSGKAGGDPSTTTTGSPQTQPTQQPSQGQ